MPTRSKRCAVRATRAGHDDPGGADRDVRRREPGRAIRVEEHRVGDDAEERGHRAEHEGLGRQPRTAPRPTGGVARHGGHVAVVSAVAAVGRGALANHRDERGDDSVRERRPIGEQLVEERLIDPQQRRRLERRHRRRTRLGHEGRELADGRAGTEVDSVASPRWTRSEPRTTANRCSSTAPSAMTTRARGDLDLGRPLRDGREGPARDVGEQADAVERHDALDRRQPCADRGPRAARRDRRRVMGRSQARA